MSSDDDETARLRRAFDALPKVHGHGETMEERHSDVLPEWVMLIIADPHEVYDQYNDGVLRTILVGRVPESRLWIKVVFEGTLATGQFLTAYRDRRLNRRYGRGPWPNLEE